jgi:hypothetical protein
MTPVIVRSKESDCGRSITVIAGSNPAQVMNVRLLCLLCVVSVAVSATG